MNITFWVLMISMLLLAIGLLVYPLLKSRQFSSLAYKESNLKINDDKIKELDIDLEEGRIDQLYYRAAREELDRELLIDIPAESKETANQHYTSAARRHPALALVISVFVPMLALLLYLELGMHAASEESFKAEQVQQDKPLSMEKMTALLEQRIEKNGGTAEEWAMLARAHKYMGNNDQAVMAFEVALEQDANNAQLMLEYAEVVALANNRNFNDKARELVLKAYALEPGNANVLWFIGVAEYQAGNYHEAIEHLRKLLPMAVGDENVMKSIVSVAARSRQQLVNAGEKMPELEELMGIKALKQQAVAAQQQAPESPPVRTLRLKVKVADTVSSKFAADDTVFVYAKARKGPRMPLAAQRLTLAELPAEVVLDDSMAMVDGMNLSAFDELVVSARLSNSGSAIAQSGDYIGQVEVSGSADEILLVTIDTVVP